MDGRISGLDIAKGFSILFIVLGHASYGFVSWFCYAFNSAVFFVLAGMSFCRLKGAIDSLLCFDNRKVRIFAEKTIRKLLFPYFIWGSISIVIYYLMGRIVLLHLQTSKGEKNFAVLENFLGLLYGNSETQFFEFYRPLWFIPCLVMVEVVWFLILKVMYNTSEKRAWILYCSVMSFFLAFGVMESVFQWNLILPFETESAIFMSFFFGVGLLLRSWGKLWQSFAIMKENRMRFTILLLIWIVVAFGGICLNGNTSARVDYFANVGLFIFNALWMSLGIIYISFVIQSFPVMEYIGKRTFAILVMHKYPIMIIKLFPGVQTKLQAGNFIVEIFIVAITIMCCLLAERVISRFIPQLFGNKIFKEVN